MKFFVVLHFLSVLVSVLLSANIVVERFSVFQMWNFFVLQNCNLFCVIILTLQLSFEWLVRILVFNYL